MLLSCLRSCFWRRNCAESVTAMVQRDFDLPELPLEPPEEKIPQCPYCQSECRLLYKRDKLVIGCDVCIDMYDAYDYMMEIEEE